MFDVFKIYDVPFDDKPTYEMLAKGKTLGCFQIESPLLTHWTKVLVPLIVDDMALLVAVIRPGVLNVKYADGRSATQVIADRRKKLDDTKTGIDALDPLLLDTNYVIVYQEQISHISRELAGFNGVEAETLRKNVGKKDADAIVKTLREFVDRAEIFGKITREQAQLISDQIKESGRYAFCKCLDINTLVETEYGFKKIADVKVGDFVKAPTSDYTSDEFVEVLAKYNNGVQELYEVILESGKTINCTLNHKLLCGDGVTRKLSDILSGDYTVVVDYGI